MTRLACWLLPAGSALIVILTIAYCVRKARRTRDRKTTPSAVQDFFASRHIHSMHVSPMSNEGLAYDFILAASITQERNRQMKELADAVAGQPAGWRTLETVAKQSVITFLPQEAEGGIDFAAFVRCITFRFWLVGFLRARSDTLDRENLYELLSNDSTRNTLPAEVEQFIPSHENTTPPEIVIQAYEKLWQFVAAAVVHCEKDESRTLRHILLDFRDNPTDRQLVAVSGGNGRPSVVCIMNEVLRLHPPISHISRTVVRIWCQLLAIPSVEVADIGAVQQRDTHGELLPDTTRFDPSRWQRDPQPAFFAFGGGLHACPAENWAPRAAALVASLILEQVDGVKFRFERMEYNDAGQVWDGWSVHKGKRRDATNPSRRNSSAVHPDQSL